MTKTISGTIKDVSGAPAPARIFIELVQAEAFTTAKASLAPGISVEPNSSGVWTTNLTENDLIEPSGTLYRVTEKYPKRYGPPKTYYIQVLSTLGVGVNQVYDLIVPELLPVGVVGNFVTKSYADSTYSTIGTSTGPAGPAGPPGSSAVISGTEAFILAQTPNDGVHGYCTDSHREYLRNGGTWTYIKRGAPEEEFAFAFSPGSNLDTTALGTFVDWVTITSALTVPPWASRARVRIFMSGVTTLTAVPTTYALQIVCAGATQQATVADAVSESTVGLRAVHFGFQVDLTGLSVGTGKILKIQSARVSGTGFWRANTGSVFSGAVTFFAQ